MRIARTVVLLIAVLVSVGCARVQPVYNVPDTAVDVSNANGVEEIRTAILAGAQAKGWEVDELGPGHMVASVVVRHHTATVDIYYDNDSYSIQYRDSSYLLYDGSNIHRNYNKWIVLLDEQIRLNLPSE